MPLQYIKQEVKNEVDFLHADKYRSFQQADYNTLAIKVFFKVIIWLLMGVFKDSQSTQNNKFGMLLQNL